MRSFSIKSVLLLSFLTITFFCNAQVKIIASFNGQRNPGSQEIYFLNELKDLIEEKNHLSVDLIGEPDLYNGDFIYITPIFEWTEYMSGKIRYERICLVVSYFPEDRPPVTEKYHIGGFTIQRKKGAMKKALKDFKMNLPGSR